ncbi:MAG TPA: aldehyde dehydrogenase family protein, partial [Acidimicrobiales bacterium]|nr:aldehyde dehydrogenase family protein [Acidimicrobiales bacterium]
MADAPGDVQLFVDGSYTPGSGNDRHPVTSPVTGEVIGSVPVPTAADLDAAVAAARDAQRGWARTNVWERARICHAIGDALAARVEELARLQTLEQGKPLAESRGDITEAATLFHLHAEDAVRLTGETIASTDSGKRMWTFYRPVGTWGIITPWNFPLLMFAEFVAPGLATGNAHVVKPPAHTSFTVLAAMSVLADADLEAAARAAVYGAYVCSGQVCCATERVVVDASVRREFVDAVVAAADEVRLGDPFDAATNLGPLNN